MAGDDYICVMCQDQKAEIVCDDCKRINCAECDQMFHKPAKRAKHKRRPMFAFQPKTDEKKRAPDQDSSFAATSSLFEDGFTVPIPSHDTSNSMYQWLEFNKSQSQQGKFPHESSSHYVNLNPIPLPNVDMLSRSQNDPDFFRENHTAKVSLQKLLDLPFEPNSNQITTEVRQKRAVFSNATNANKDSYPTFDRRSVNNDFQANDTVSPVPPYQFVNVSNIVDIDSPIARGNQTGSRFTVKGRDAEYEGRRHLPVHAPTRAHDVAKLPQFQLEADEFGVYENRDKSGSLAVELSGSFAFEPFSPDDRERRSTLPADLSGTPNPDFSKSLFMELDNTLKRGSKVVTPELLDFDSLVIGDTKGSEHEILTDGNITPTEENFRPTHFTQSIGQEMSRISKPYEATRFKPNELEKRECTVPNFCSNCGSKFAGGNFCSNCGSKITSASVSQVNNNQKETVDLSDPFFTPPLSPKNERMADDLMRQNGPRTKIETKKRRVSFHEEPDVRSLPETENIYEEIDPESDHELDSGFEHIAKARSNSELIEDAMLMEGLKTLTYLREQVKDGSTLDDVELMLSGVDMRHVEDVAICGSAVEDTTNAVNDIFASKLNQELKPKKLIGLSVAERSYALEACEFDTMKAATFARNSRTYLCHQVAVVDENKSRIQTFHQKMQQNEGNYRSAFAEVQSGIFDNLMQSRIWNSDENANILQQQDSDGSNSFDDNALTLTDTWLEESLRKANVQPGCGIFAKAVFFRKIMAEKRLPLSRAQLLFSMLKNKQDLEYKSALWVARNCTSESLRIAKGHERYIKECGVCGDEFATNFIIKLPNCVNDCHVCHNCMKRHLVVQLKESGKNVKNILCPGDGCEQKIISNNENDLLLQQLFRNFLPQDIFKLFDDRVLEGMLEEDVYFKWCSDETCPEGISWENPRVLKMQCPRGHFTCFECGRKWVEQHEGLTCEQFSQWEMENNPEYQNKRLDGYLRAIDAMKCPQCKFRYELVRGGCLHFKCGKCQTEFCGFCYALYSRDCRKSQKCATRGLHQHCPRFHSIIHSTLYT